MPIFPNVPNVPGVPPLLRNPLAALPPRLELLTRNVLGVFGLTDDPQWGIFQDGFPVIAADSVVTFDYKQRWYVADYTLEQGAFESYDKVATPFDVRLTFSRGGSSDDRQDLLRSIEAIAGNLQLYDVVTAERVYVDVNITNYGYRRAAQQGMGLLSVDVGVVQIRASATATFSAVKSPSGSGQVNGGTVEGQEPTPDQTNKIPSVQ